jgi:ABC-2 type transport system permease protein
LLFAASRLSLHPSIGWLVVFLVNLASSAAIVMAFSYVWGSLAFWAPRAAEEISSSALRMVSELSPFPLDGLAPAVLGGMLTLIPAGFVAWLPCRALLGIDSSPFALLATPLAALVIAAGSAWIFAKGRRHYERVGSQRYLPHGHRG